MSVKRTLALTAAAVASALVLAACGNSGGEDAANPGPAASETTEATSRATPAQGEHNDQDIMFAQMMIPHHAQAIEMSDVVLGKDGVDERVVALAEQVKAAQAPEIERMTGWLQGWGEEVPDTDTSGMGGMDHSGGGMTGEDNMQALAEADGPEASRLFLEQMMEHHRGAIEMAEKEVAEGQNPEATDLAQTIIETQQAEIEEMETLLGSL